jgi:hypothetical protein
MDQFNEDEDEEKEEDESSQQSEEIKKHKKSSSLTESANNQIKEKLFNTNREIVKKNQNKKRKRDEFGYFVNDDENSNNEEENEEKSDSNENKDEDNINHSSQKKEEENENEDEVNNSIKDNEEEEKENNEDNNNNDENRIDNVNDGEFQEKENEQNNNDDNYNDNNVNNEEIKENEKEKNVEKINDKKEESNIDEINKEKTNEENDLINELYNKPKTDNFEQPEVELFRMGSFRPNPVPGSPKFSKRISKNEELLIEKIDKNNNNNVNNNLDNFTETIETKIEGDKHNAQNPEKNQANKTIPIYTHNNDIISLGKIPPVKIINNNNNELLNQKAKEETQSKSNENEEKAEEDFLKREELKIQKNKENTEKKEDKEENKNVKEINIKKDEEEGKENVTEDEEEEIKNKKINSNSKDTEQNENNQIERKESGKEMNNDIYSAKNSINNENNIKRSNNNDIEEIKVKDLSIKLLTQYQKEGNSMTSSAEHSHQNSGLKNNNIIINNNTNRNMGVNRNIYSKKIADRNNNKNNKKIIIHQVNQKRAIYESPSDKNFVKKEINYSIDQNQVLSSNQKISPFNYNNVSNFSKKLNTQKKQELQNIKKNLNNINNDQRANSYEKVNKNSEEKYSFKPQINENSRKMYEKKLSNFNKNINNNNNNNQPGQQKQTTRSELLLLYEDANVIQNKINKEYIKQNNEIISKANKKKINDNSYNMVNNRLNKRIDNAINKFQNNLKLNIVNMTQCLYEFNIINELIKPKDNVQDININNQIDLAELQAMVESVKDNDIKKSEEVELIEQLWYLLNPKLEQNFNCEILSIFLKLFFCDNYTQKELEVYIKSLLDNYKINNTEKTEEYKSPLRNKTYDKTGIWSLHQFIKVFLNLKKNLKAYRENDYTKGDLYYNIIKEKDKELTFEPDFEKTSKYFYKYSNFQYNKDNSIIDLINKYSKKNKQKHDFNKVYERFKAEKERHEKTLQRIREIEEEKELKMCTNVPKINKYKPPTRSPIKNQLKENNEILNTEEKLQKNKSFIKQPRYKLLYDLRKKYEKNPKENRIDKNDILDQNCTFKPKITDMDIMNKTFSNIKKTKKPKGFNDYVNRNRSLLEKKEHEKKLEEDKRYGRGYDKLQKMKIKPLNITFSNKSASKPKKNNDYINNTETKRKNRYNLENDKIENIIDNIYITMDIKVSIGVIKPLKIYNKSDKETIDNISNFCKIYRFNEETKRMLIKKALKLKYNFFGKNIENSRERFIMGEDLDTITNTYSNDGNI